MAKDTSKFLSRAEDAVRTRNYQLALKNYLWALAAVPEDLSTRTKLRDVQRLHVKAAGAGKAGAFFSLAYAYLLQLLGKRDQAIASCEMALFKNDGYVQAMQLLAETAARKGYLELAAWQRRELAERLPKDAANLQKLASLYEDLERPQDAIAALETLKSVNPEADIDQRLTNLQARQTSRIYSEGVAGGSRSIVQNQDEANKLEMESGKLRTDEQREKVIELIKAQDLAGNPDDHRIWLRLADIAGDLSDWSRAYPEAKGYLDKAAQLNPQDNTVKDRQGDLEIKRLRQELRRLKAAVDAAPADAEARKAFDSQRRGVMDFEVAEFERRVKAQPLKADFHARLGELYFQTRRYEEAIAELQQAAKDPKYRIAALTMLGRSFVENRQLDLAIEQYQKAREGQEVFEKIRDPLYYEGQALEAKGDPESLRKALAIFMQIYQVDINFRDVRTKVPALQAKAKA